MKKKLLFTLLISVLLVGCGSTDTTDVEENNGANTQQVQQEIEPQTEPQTVHEHVYTEAITTDATCEADGEKTFTCECGDSYTESIPALGHSYGEYVYNNDATTSADGTETATCSVCGGTDTRIKAGTKIEITYDGYDEFGNGFVWCYDGAFAGKRAADADPYKVFYVNNPYPTYEAVWVSDKEVYCYTIYGVRGMTTELCNEMAQKNGIPWDDRIKQDSVYKGVYNGQMIIYHRYYIE